MPTKQELVDERETRLDELENSYRTRVNNIQQEMDSLRVQAAEKQAKGEDISNEINKYSELKEYQDRCFDTYKSNREEIYSYYDKEISAVEKEQEQRQDYSY